MSVKKPSRRAPLTLNQLQEWLEDLRNITFDRKVSLLNLRFLQTNDLKDKGSREFLNSGFGLHLRQQYHFTLVTQLDKLFSESSNQQRSFIHLFKHLLDHPMDESMNTERLVPTKGWIDTTHMHALMARHQKRLNPLADSIRRITIHRNAVTAHTAVKRPRTGPTLDDFAVLTDEAIKIVNTLEKKVGHYQTLFGYLKTFEVKFMVHHVAEAFRYREEEKLAEKQRR